MSGLTIKRLKEIQDAASKVTPPNEYDRKTHEFNRCDDDCVLCNYYGRGSKKGKGPTPKEARIMARVIMTVEAWREKMQVEIDKDCLPFKSCKRK